MTDTNINLINLIDLEESIKRLANTSLGVMRILSNMADGETDYSTQCAYNAMADSLADACRPIVGGNLLNPDLSQLEAAFDLAERAR